MTLLSSETMHIVREQDVVLLLSRVREHSARAGLQLLNQTKLLTAASELARNMLRYANGGQATIEALRNNARSGLKITFLDEGPGIPDIQQAMRSGLVTGPSASCVCLAGFDGRGFGPGERDWVHTVFAAADDGV